MSDLITLSAQEQAFASPEDLRRTAFYFDSRGQALFGWLQVRESALHADHGIIICPPLGHEQIHSHRSLRHLADGIAEAGFPLVRFDYHGTGDSSGSGEEPERLSTWLANIRDACLWLKHHLGCTRISLIGLRLGATLAAQVATDTRVDGLILWAPVIKGRSYVREMKALSRTAADSPKPAGDIEAAGFVLTDQTAQELGGLDLLQLHPRFRRALIIARDDIPSDLGLLKHFEQLGIEAAQTAQPGYVDMMAEPHNTKVPQQAIACAVDWLLAGTCGETFKDNVSPTAVKAFQEYADRAIGIDQDIREHAFFISKDPNLFAILTEPTEPSRTDLPVVVMINAGSCYRVGPNRLYVSLARQLAHKGFRSLRMDLCGLGDSIASDSATENNCYPATAFRDIDLTLRYIRAQLGAKRVVLLGLCSGAYTAFQTAAQLSSPVLVESVLINPLTFYWREGMSLELSPAHQLQSFQDFMVSLWRPRKWLKFLSGRSKIGIAGAMKMLAQRWQISPTDEQNSVNCETAPTATPTHPLREDLPGDLDRVVKNGRRLACFFARSDPGYGILEHQAKRKVEELRHAGMLSVYFLEDADHTFSRRGPRRALEQAIIEHLMRRYRY